MRVKVEFEVEVEDGHTDDDVEEWLRFELGDNGRMSGSNPLCHNDVEPVLGTFNWDLA